MTMPDLVAGESRETLLQALLRFRIRRNRSGMYSIDATLPNALADPLVRALERVEEELVQIDLEGGQGAVDRTPEHRRADAFMVLIERVLVSNT